MKHLVDLDQLSIDEIESILASAEAFKKGKKVKYKDKLIANLFFEPSTRTQTSFEAAQHRLGMEVMNFNNDGSSLNKGESIYDTVKTISQYVDGLVIRHTENNFFAQWIEKVDVPIINAGDGIGNHPSQSLLDLLTIQQEFGDFEALKIVIVGDLAHSRVAQSNIKVMKRLGMTVYGSSPQEWQIPGVKFVELDAIIEEVDVIMLLRIQKERHLHNFETFDDYIERFSLNQKRYDRLKENAIIMHPAPVNRDVEITSELVESEKSRIFKQMKNGMYVRMAILDYVFKEDDHDTH